MTAKQLLLEATVFSALVAITVVYKRLERHDDYLAVAVAILLMIPVGVVSVLWHRKLQKDGD